MHTPFQEQASDYDCAPTTLLNALRHLYPRASIPADTVRQIYAECLDRRAGGTTHDAIEQIGTWLNDHHHRRFKPRTEYLIKKAVHVRKNRHGEDSRLIRCLGDQGVALIRVTHDRVGRTKHWHYVLGLSYQGGWLKCYDPYPRIAAARHYRFLKHPDPRGHNLVIHKAWLDQETDEGLYHLGTLDQRRCLLIRRG